MKLLVIVDYQIDFVTGSLGFEKALSLDEGIANKIYECHNLGYKIIATKDSHNSEYLTTREGLRLPISHCINNTDGIEFYGETAKALKDVNAHIIPKSSFGINPNTFNDDFFENLDDINVIEFCGVVTNMCVLCNVIIFQAKFTESEIFVHNNLCASFDNELHDKTLDILKNLHVDII